MPSALKSSAYFAFPVTFAWRIDLFMPIRANTTYSLMDSEESKVQLGRVEKAEQTRMESMTHSLDEMEAKVEEAP